jgi:pyrimidine-nucleoside phosphorylase
MTGWFLQKEKVSHTMNAVDIIAKKRDGQVLTAQEIGFFIQGLTHGEIPDYQVAAWAMAVLLRGMTPEETADLTMAMVQSGEVLDLSSIGGVVVDKHSTGGVGDKTTLVVAPLVAAAGLPVAKMSGRGLGFSGGTLDKLESIPGMNVHLERERFLEIVHQVGIVVAGQTARLVPADGKLYALRDVTATVPSLPLIASSIMSKKIAGGCQALVLDVKVGRGAFMETLEQARELAQIMISIGQNVGRRVTAMLSDMSQPLGQAVGNALEVIEAVETLRGAGPVDFTEHCVLIGAEMLVLGGVVRSPTEGEATLRELLQNGRGLAKFRAWIEAQGGNAHVADDVSLLPRATTIVGVPAPRDGYIAAIDAREVGLTAMELGAGRHRKEDAIDPSVGIVLGRKVGQRVESGQTLLTIHAQSATSAGAAQARLLYAYAWSDAPVTAPPLIYDVVRSD